jgi:hypothetical protein
MDWCVVKSGANMFDALHAYGLAVLLSHVTSGPISLEDTGIAYALRSSVTSLRPVKINVLDKVLTLPSVEELQVFEKDTDVPIQIANLDGLLAVVFTTLGPRVLSVADLIHRKAIDPTVTVDALNKVTKAVQGRKRNTRKVSAGSPDWLQHLLRAYDPGSPVAPVPEINSSKGSAIQMTVDPAFSCAPRRVVSDGLLTHKLGVIIEGTSFAPLLTTIGAARFLRAQRLASNLVGYYLPIASALTVEPDTALPILWETARELSIDRAILSQCLKYSGITASAYEIAAANTSWETFAYQVLQTLGVQQSISYTRGSVNNSWLRAVGQHAGSHVLRYWRLVARSSNSEMPYDIDNLLDALLTHNLRSWQAHLREIALCVASRQDKADKGELFNRIRLYTLQEVKEITLRMDTSVSIPLSHVLEQQDGTIRFGHALRLLGRYNPSILRDLIDELDLAHNRENLLRTLTWLAQECALASAKTKFIFVPTDDDLKHLLDDVDRYGARAIAGLLIILSALRYPRTGAEGEDTSTEEVLIGIRSEIEEQDDDL